MHPKPSRQKADPYFKPVPYFQVFLSRYGFTANLSILDLIFNAGPEASGILKSSVAEPATDIESYKG